MESIHVHACSRGVERPCWFVHGARAVVQAGVSGATALTALRTRVVTPRPWRPTSNVCSGSEGSRARVATCWRALPPHHLSSCAPHSSSCGKASCRYSRACTPCCWTMLAVQLLQEQQQQLQPLTWTQTQPRLQPWSSLSSSTERNDDSNRQRFGGRVRRSQQASVRDRSPVCSQLPPLCTVVLSIGDQLSFRK